METHLHLTVDSITSANRPRAMARKAGIMPISASLAVRTVASHMSGVATDTANNVRSEVALLRAIVLAMSNLTTC